MEWGVVAGTAEGAGARARVGARATDARDRGRGHAEGLSPQLSSHLVGIVDRCPSRDGRGSLGIQESVVGIRAVGAAAARPRSREAARE